MSGSQSQPNTTTNITLNSSNVPFSTSQSQTNVNHNIGISAGHESLTTDLSLGSLSSINSEMNPRIAKNSLAIGLSGSNLTTMSSSISSNSSLRVTNQAKQSSTEVHSQLSSLSCQTRTNRLASGTLLQVPFERYGSAGSGRTSTTVKPGESWFEEEPDVIRNYKELSSAVLGLMKSFSTSDICSLNDSSVQVNAMRKYASEFAFFNHFSWNNRFEMPSFRRLDFTSRSLSTWVAVGDPISSTSQLPSPQAQPGFAESPSITAYDFVKSVNKKVRQMYIRKRLISTYKAMGRITRSDLNISELNKSISPQISIGLKLIPQVQIQNTPSSKPLCLSFDLDNLCFKTLSDSISLSVKDIERDKGKPLTKYERNFMIFNWLQNIEEVDSLEQIT